MKNRFNRPTRKAKNRRPKQELSVSTADQSSAGLQAQTSEQDSVQSSGFQRPLIYSILLVCVFVLGMVSGFLIWGQNTPSAVNPVADSGQTLPTPAQQITRYPVEEGGNPSIGPDDAPITIIEFSDYQCPYCQRWESQVFQKLLDEYPTQVRIVYRDFPLNGIHPEAAPAANAANCAGEQDAYWQYHNKLFSYELNLGKEAYLQYAKELKLDMTTFTACLESDRYAAEVTEDLSYILDLTSRFNFQQSTPTFFINGIYIVGALPYDSFKNVIDRELAGDIP